MWHEIGNRLAIAGDHHRLASLCEPRQLREPVLGVFDRYGCHGRNVATGSYLVKNYALMVRQIRSGVLDLIGAARPSIADPFLPRKIDEGRLADIRECIGCNICVAGDHTMSPSRCTQNPSMGEEWRRGWHPERIRPLKSPAKILAVGAGPAGLEAAMSRRGYDVALAEKTERLGGRVARERLLPGLSAWGRVAEYRIGQIEAMANVEIYRASALTAEDILGFGFDHVVLATGSRWRGDGIGRYLLKPVPSEAGARVLTRTTSWTVRALPAIRS
jgi:dimethylamine/trimethylamine dehydrogenase